MERISSRQNAIVKRFRDLARTTRPAKAEVEPFARGGISTEVLMDGEHLVQEALLCDVPVEIAVFSDRLLTNVLSPAALCAEA